MVKVVRGTENTVPIKVVSLIDYTGFHAELEINGGVKTVDSLSAKSPNVVLSAEDVESIVPSTFCRFTIYNAKGEVHVIYKICFSVVDSPLEVQNFKPIRVVIVSSFNYDGINSDRDIAREVEKTVDAIIDDKVESSVSGIIQPKVEQAVDAVIDTKVEAVVNEIFESSDSTSAGGIISGLQDKIEGDMEPRLTIVESDLGDDVHPRLDAAEALLSKKISLDYDDSDDNIAFLEGQNEGDESRDGI